MSTLDKQLSIRVPPELLDLLNKEADKRGLSLADTVREMLWDDVMTPENENDLINAMIYHRFEEISGKPPEEYNPDKHELWADATGRKWMFAKRPKETIEER